MILAGVDRANFGTVRIGEVELTALTERQLLQIRAQTVAVVVQRSDRNLLGYGTALDNVRFAQRAGRRAGNELPDPVELLHQVGLARVVHSVANHLSDGKRQRLSLAVGLASAPGVLRLREVITDATEERSSTASTSISSPAPAQPSSDRPAPANQAFSRSSADSPPPDAGRLETPYRTEDTGFVL